MDTSHPNTPDFLINKLCESYSLRNQGKFQNLTLLKEVGKNYLICPFIQIHTHFKLGLYFGLSLEFHPSFNRHIYVMCCKDVFLASFADLVLKELHKHSQFGKMVLESVSDLL